MKLFLIRTLALLASPQFAFVCCVIEAYVAIHAGIDGNVFLVVLAVVLMCVMWHVGQRDLGKLIAFVVTKEINEVVERHNAQVEAKGE